MAYVQNVTRSFLFAETFKIKRFGTMHVGTYVLPIHLEKGVRTCLVDTATLIVPVRRPLVLRHLSNNHRGESAVLLGTLTPRMHLIHVNSQVVFGSPRGAALLANDGSFLLQIFLLVLFLLFC